MTLSTRGRAGHPCKSAVRRGGHRIRCGSPWLVVGVWHWNSAPSPWLLLWHLHCVQVRSHFAKNLCFFFCWCFRMKDVAMSASLLAWSSSKCVILDSSAFLPGSFSPKPRGLQARLEGLTSAAEGLGFPGRYLKASLCAERPEIPVPCCLQLQPLLILPPARLNEVSRCLQMDWSQPSLWLWEQMKPLLWARDGWRQQEHTTWAGEKDWIQECHKTHSWH